MQRGSSRSPATLEPIGPDWALQGRRTRLRLLGEKDLPARLAMTNDPAVQLETVGMAVGERTPYDIRSWFAALSADPNSRQIAIEDESGRYIGDLDLHSFDPSRGEAWVEVLLGDPALRARGEAEAADCLADALGTLLTFAFGPLGLQKVLAEVLSTNPVARRALSALGFREVGQIDHLNGVISHILELTDSEFHGSPAAAPPGPPANP